MTTAVLSAATLGAARLFAPAFACGLNLYATVVVLGLASRLGWTDALPVGLRGLEHGVIIGSALALYVIEFAVDKVRWLNSLWDAVHTVIRPAAAALLAALALEGAPPMLRAAGAVLAACAALGAHGLKAGLRIRLNALESRLPGVAASLLEDAAAVGIVLSALLWPHASAGIGVGLALLLVLTAPTLFCPAVLGVRALHARLRGFFASGWRGPEALPSSVRRLVQTTEIGAAPPRVTRAALLSGGNGAGRFRNGWLVLENDGAAFLYRDGWRRPRRLPLLHAASARIRSGVLGDTLDFREGAGDSPTLLLLKDGPSPHFTQNELLSRS